MKRNKTIKMKRNKKKGPGTERLLRGNSQGKRCGHCVCLSFSNNMLHGNARRRRMAATIYKNSFPMAFELHTQPIISFFVLGVLIDMLRCLYSVIMSFVFFFATRWRLASDAANTCECNWRSHLCGCSSTTPISLPNRRRALPRILLQG